MDNLPEKCREIFLMSKRDGLSNDEIAAELAISVKTVKNQMTKALARLREALDGGHKPFFFLFFNFWFGCRTFSHVMSRKNK